LLIFKDVYSNCVSETSDVGKCTVVKWEKYGALSSITPSTLSVCFDIKYWDTFYHNS
jgi:hypothetical protein